jgi:hypothetical protein
MFMKLLEEWLDEYSQRPDRDPEWTWSDFENFATWLDNRSAQHSVQRTAKKSAEEKGEWVRLADSVFPNRRR